MPGRRSICPSVIVLVAALVIFSARPTWAQSCGTKPGRVAVILGGYAGATGAAIAVRHDTWWVTPRTGFHVVWDESPSKGQDRLLHAAISYHAAQLGAVAWDWACVPYTTAGWLGAALGVAIGIPKEIGDGLHADQGFSAPDMLFNAGGALLPALHRQWPVTRAFQVKVNYWPSEEFRAPPPFPELENDYAGQRYFLAINPGLAPGGAGPWPDWLGLAIGHSVPQWIVALPEHQWYVAADLNLRGLPIEAGWWKTFATIVDQVHIPLPGIRMQEGEVVLGLF
jgi:hypothetical protein